MVKQSALLDFYRSRGVTLIEYDDWLLPAHFGDTVAEYHAVRNRVGMLDLCQRNLLRLKGENRTAVLNNNVSNDVTALTTGQGLHAAFLDLQGKVLADTRIFCARDFLIVDIPESRKERLLAQVQCHGEVEVDDLFGDFTMLSLQGPNAEKLVTEVTITNGLPCHDLAHMQVTIADSKVTLIVVTHGAERGYDLVIPVTVLPNVVSQIEEVGKRWSLSWIGVEAQDMLRIEAGVPIYGVDITEENSLLETGQERWVNFERQFAGFLLQTKQTIRRGAKIYDGEREVGTVTSCRFSPHTNSAVALGYVQRNLIPRACVTIRDGEQSFVATVSFLPFREQA
jgi:glycine cleavage system aminomethyltransferase T